MNTSSFPLPALARALLLGLLGLSMLGVAGCPPPEPPPGAGRRPVAAKPPSSPAAKPVKPNPARPAPPSRKPSPPWTLPESGLLRLSAEELYELWEGNRGQADKKLPGRELVVTGKLLTRDEDFQGKPIWTLATKHPVGRVVLYPKPSEQAPSEGAPLEARCRIRDHRVHVVLEACVLEGASGERR